ncbi:glycosyltransferase [Scytonema hofmannii FACHB-248]|uniref:Glycosyltransferase n=2 Tax=Scytonema hofmannii TaxID=34078 RepID=A0ABR8GTL6_9CYAN|nr:glycosyltransferase [[Scytonema hofmanni] UTEX B 1581]MBD2606762.1 glycosyltransferase [Scytonema hofmannii FACHB-248]
MQNTNQKNKYVFYARELNMQPNTAHQIHDVLCANAAANLGYSTVLIYGNKHNASLNPVELIRPSEPKQPHQEFIDFYNVDEALKILPLPLPWPIDRIAKRWLNTQEIVSKYYFPKQIQPHAKIVHTQDWQFVKLAIKNQIPVIYERHYFQDKQFEPEIVNSPYFQLAITQSEIIRQSLIKYGMPEKKVIWLHNGFSQAFLQRQPEEAQAWRQELLVDGRKHLVVYSGALYRFKGIDDLIDAAKYLPEIQFAITGGKDSQVKEYQQIAQDKNVTNVKFLGWILPRERLVSLMQAADVLAHPHCSGEAADFTNPVKFFQYMATGTPIAVTEIPPLMEFKNTPLVAGWCEPDNPHKFAECIQQILEKYPRKVEGYTDSINFGKQFSWEDRIQKTLSYVDASMRPVAIN